MVISIQWISVIAICLRPCSCPERFKISVRDFNNLCPCPCLYLCQRFQICRCPCPPCTGTTVQASRCVGHGGIRLYHQKISSIERRVTNEKLLKNRFLSLVQNHFWSFLALLIKRRSLSPFEMTRLYQNHSKSK